MRVKQEGDFKKAQQLLTSLIKKDKQNAGLWFQLGLVQRYQKKIDEAMASQNIAMELSPKDNDIKLELARLYSLQGNYDKAKEEIKEILATQPGYEDAQKLALNIENEKLQKVSPLPYKWQMDFGYELSKFSRIPQPYWRNSFIQIARWINNTLVHFRAENDERFHIHNEYYELGVLHKFNENNNAGISLGYTPWSVFIPQWRIKLDGETRVMKGRGYFGDIWLTGNIENDRYKTLNTTVLKPGLRYSITDNLQISGQHIDLFDENNKLLMGWSTRLDWQTPHEPLNIYGGLSEAPETDNAVTVNTKARFAGFSYQINPRVKINTSYSH